MTTSAEAFVYEPLSPEFDANPAETYRYLREHHPVWEWQPGVFLVSGYADVQAVLTNTRLTFPDFGGEVRGEAGALHRKLMKFSFFGFEGEQHARIRRLVVPWFTRTAVERLRADVEEIVAELMDSFGRDHADLVADFADHLPQRVMSRALGVPGEHGELFARFSKGLITTSSPWLPPEEYDRQVAVFPEAVAMITGLIGQRRATPGDDLISKLIQVQENDRLSVDELLGVVASLIVAASQTVTHLIGHAVRILLTQPVALAEVKADPSLLPGAVAETMRFDAFSKHGIARLATEPVELAGGTVPAGSVIVLLVSAALRDPAQFDDPDTFDPHRPPSMLMFGGGPRLCFGHVLAKLEAETAVAELLRRYPDATLAGPAEYQPNLVHRAMVSLPLKLR